MDQIKKLYQQSLARQKEPKEGSYTNYLLNEGTEKICKKVGEEATEVVIASMKSDKEELANELADLAYHVTVLMVNQGISPEDVENILMERTKKTGNKKAERAEIIDL